MKEGDTIPIGEPIPNAKAFVINQDDQIQPIGVAGELCLSGDLLARGYLNNPELTAERFVEKPLFYEKRVYRTGDLALWTEGGEIEFLGRIDHQVKIRGRRIELGEIQSHLVKHPNIAEAVVNVLNVKGESYICAYIVCLTQLNMNELRAFLSNWLPEYMMPTYFIPIHKIPLTSNGKINYKSLPFPDVSMTDQFVLPSTKEEIILVGIWSELLGVNKDRIGVGDNFFTLGGHSLNVIKMILKIMKEFNVKISIDDVFDAPTVQEIAKCIIRYKWAGRQENQNSNENKVTVI